MIKNILLVFVMVFQIFSAFSNGIFEKISNKTWVEESGFGVTVVFIRTENGLIKAIRQFHGSGVPVIFSEICDTEIRHDTIFLTNSFNIEKNEKEKSSFYIYNDDQGLLKNGKPLIKMFDQSKIFVSTEQRKINDKEIIITDQTRFSFEKNEVYIEDKVYKIYKQN
jgi:hypothetical protein